MLIKVCFYFFLIQNTAYAVKLSKKNLSLYEHLSLNNTGFANKSQQFELDEIEASCENGLTCPWIIQLLIFK